MGPTLDMHAVLAQSPGQHLAFLPTANPEYIAETLTAFANTDGGTVVLGVAEDGRLGDIFVEEDASDALQAALRLCRPPVRTDWSQQQVAGGTWTTVRRVRPRANGWFTVKLAPKRTTSYRLANHVAAGAAITVKAP